jgi:hypothetical protein
MGTGSIMPWRAGASQRADLALAGSALALSPFAIGGAPRRRLVGVAYTGKRRMRRALLKTRGKPVSLAEIHAARVVPELGNLLNLLSASVLPEWIAGQQYVIGFETTGTGAGSWIARSDKDGRISVQPGRGDTDATITVPTLGAVPLFIGNDMPAAGRAMFTGDADKALAMLGWFDRAQRSLPPPRD